MKLYKLLKSFDKSEFSRFSKFLRSPFFNHTDSFIRFYGFLKKCYPTFNPDKLNLKIIWENVFPKEPYHEIKCRRLISDFTKLVKDYLAILELEKETNGKQKYYIKALGARNMYDIFEKETEKQLKALITSPFRDMEYQREIADLNYEYYFHPLTAKHTLQDDAIAALMDSFDRYFILGKLRIGSELKSRGRTLSKQYDLRFLKNIFEEGATGFMEDNLLFGLYQLLFQLYELEEHEAVFQKMKKQLSENVFNIRRTDQSLLLTQMINYTVRQINSGNAAFYKESLDLYRIGLENGLVVENERINEAVFGNIVLLGCHAEEFDWTKHFIQDYQIYLDEKIKGDAVALNTGLWYFHQDDFEKAYLLFLDYSFSPAYQPKSRSNLIRALFEQFLLDESLFDLLNSQLNSFEKYLHRNNLISLIAKESYLNQVIILKRWATGIFQRKDLKKLKPLILEQINKRERIIGRKWLVEKIDS